MVLLQWILSLLELAWLNVIVPGWPIAVSFAASAIAVSVFLYYVGTSTNSVRPRLRDWYRAKGMYFHKQRIKERWMYLSLLPGIAAIIASTSCFYGTTYRLLITVTVAYFSLLYTQWSVRPFLHSLDSQLRLRNTELKQDLSGYFLPLHVPPDSPPMKPTEWFMWFITSRFAIAALFMACLLFGQLEQSRTNLIKIRSSTGPDFAVPSALSTDIKDMVAVCIEKYWPAWLLIIFIVAFTLRFFARRVVIFRISSKGDWDLLRSPGPGHSICSGTHKHIRCAVISNSTINVRWYVEENGRALRQQRQIHTAIVSVILAGEPDQTIPIASFPQLLWPDNQYNWNAGGRLRRFWGGLPRATASAGQDGDKMIAPNEIASATSFCKMLTRNKRGKDLIDIRIENDAAHDVLGVPTPVNSRKVALPWQAFINERIRPLSTFFQRNKESVAPQPSGISSTLQLLVRQSLSLVTTLSAAGMIATFAYALKSLGEAFAIAFVEKKMHEGNDFLTSALHAIELMILAPLPYLLMLGLNRYVHAVTGGKDTKKAKAELLDFKGFEIALLIGATAAVIVSMLLSTLLVRKSALEQISITNQQLWMVGLGIVLIAVLAIYYFHLEKAADVEQEHVRANPSDVLPFELQAQHLRRQGRFKEAADCFEQAGHFVLSLSQSIDDPRGLALIAEGELCRIMAAIESGESLLEREARASFAEILLGLSGRDDQTRDRYVIPLVMFGTEVGLTESQMGLDDIKKILAKNYFNA